MSKTKTTRLGIRVARAIVAGDVSMARALASGVYHWSVPESRAIIGACEHVNATMNANVCWQSILWGDA